MLSNRAFALVLSLSSLPACAGDIAAPPAQVQANDAALFDAASECPTAPTNRSLGYFLWRTQRYVNQALWSSDGELVLGVETAYEERRSWDPLNGTTDKRRTCHRAFVQRLDGSNKRYLGAEQPGQGGQAFFMRQGSDAGAYVLLQVLAGPVHTWQRIALDGTRTTLARDERGRANLVPSPDGQRIAQVTPVDACDVPPEGPLPDARTELRMLDARGMQVSPGQTVTAACFALSFTWRPDGAFVMGDGVRATAFDASGSALGETSVPRCVNPPTTSSWVDARGRALDITDGIHVIDENPALAFGCQ